CMCLTVGMGLWVTSLVYGELGSAGFGVFAAAQAVMTLFLIVVDAFSSGVERNIAYAVGEKDDLRVRRIVGSALVFSGCAAAGLLLFALVAAPWLAGTLQATDADREHLPAALRWIGAITALTIVQAPYKSLLVAKQSIYLVNIYELVEAVVRLAAAGFLVFSLEPTIASYGKYTFFGVACTTTSLVLLCSVYMTEARLCKPSELHRVASFGFWVLLGSLAWKLRTQGAQVITNVLCGAVATTSYAVGLQLAMYQNNLTFAVYRATRPAMITAQGKRNIEQVRAMTRGASKVLSFVTLYFAVPFLFEAGVVLDLWLKDPSELMTTTVRYIVLAMALKDLTAGHIMACHARGKIAWHEVTVVAVNAVALLASSALIYWRGFPPSTIPLSLVVATVALNVIRVTVFRRIAQFGLWEWLDSVFSPYAAAAVSASIAALLVQWLMAPSLLRVIAVTAATTCTLTVVIAAYGLSSAERALLNGLLRRCASVFRRSSALPNGPDENQFSRIKRP
ncbi:MAG: oligosaccharide flippase family protein, partial [Planctomycetales bacterium]|nr:oligosaccharide flippase family protein [Planctomycetales bacterium]